MPMTELFKTNWPPARKFIMQALYDGMPYSMALHTALRQRSHLNNLSMFSSNFIPLTVRKTGWGNHTVWTAGALSVNTGDDEYYSVLPRFSKGQGAIWKGHFSAVNGPSKGHFSAVNRPSKGHFSTVNWRKRALLTKSALEWLNKWCTAQSTLCVGNKKGKTELKAMCDWVIFKKKKKKISQKGRASFRLFQKGRASRKGGRAPRPAKED